MNGVGNRLKELRISERMTMEETGKAVGASKMAVSRWESGQRQPKPEYIQAYADFFNVPVEWIKNGDFFDYAKEIMIEAANNKVAESKSEKEFKNILSIVRKENFMGNTPNNNLKIINSIVRKIENTDIELYTGYDRSSILKAISSMIVETYGENYIDDVKKIKKYIGQATLIAENIDISDISRDILFNCYEDFNGKSGLNIIEEKQKALQESVMNAQKIINGKCDEFLQIIEYLEDIDN